MPKKKKSVELLLDEKLRDSERQATSISLPLAIHYRLDLLAELADDTAASRAEIVGMLIAEAELDQEVIERQVMRYRKLKVRDALPPQAAGVQPLDNVVSITKRGPGRPARHESG